jgi:integrative and conjugative element protein (TIGR02256 family)
MAGELGWAVVAPAAIEQMRREMRARRLTETGGALVGRVIGDTVYITAASGPGSNAVLQIFSVEIDGAHAQRFCDAEFRRSDGEVDYVGDWHCHPAISTSPSRRDRKAMAIMSEHEGMATETPVSLIYSRLTGRYSVYVFEAGGALRKLAVGSPGDAPASR